MSTKKTAAAKSKKADEEAASYMLRFKFSDSARAFEIDPFDLTGEEQIAIEEFFDLPWNRLLASGWLLESRKAAVFLAYLARQRQEENFSYQQAVGLDPKIEKEGTDEDRPTKGSNGNGSQS